MRTKLGWAATAAACVAVCAVVLLLSTDSAIGAEVSEKTAAAAVEGWLRLDPAPLAEPLDGTVQSVEASKDGQGDIVYSVAVLKPSGFVILPADNLVEPIIAFAAQGCFDPHSTPPAVSPAPRTL